MTDDTSGERKEAEAVYVEFPDRNVVPAKIVGVDPFADVALLEVEPDGFELHPLALGDDRDLEVGQPVAAIGSPFGEQQSLSVGIVSATDRSVRSLTEFQIEGAIQTDASINPGNSGGPLLDENARVIGINQQIETNSGRQRRGRLRGPDHRRETLDRPARRRRQGRIRLHRRLDPGALPAARRPARPRHRLRGPARRSRPRRSRRRSRASRRRREDPVPGPPLPHRRRRRPLDRRPQGRRTGRPRQPDRRLRTGRHGDAGSDARGRRNREGRRHSRHPAGGQSGRLAAGRSPAACRTPPHDCGASQ